jgi:hypothetical protein
MTNNYNVTESGEVISMMNWRGYGNRVLQKTLNSDGYPSVRIMMQNGHRKRIAVHVLVARKYYGECPKGMQIRHLDGNKMNCHKDNLKYGTAKENALDREIHGKTSRGVTHSQKIKQGIYGAI